MLNKKFEVLIQKRVLKRVSKLPNQVQKKLALLLIDLRDGGPVLPKWPNFSKLNGNKYHCHLGYSWVACWEKVNNQLLIEVYYVGSRENAPY